MNRAMSRLIYIFAIAAAVTAARPSWSAVIVGYDPAYHKTSGIGGGVQDWNAVSAQGRLTMISPTWGLTSAHFPASGPQTFAGTSGSRQIVSTVQIVGTDLLMQQLDAPVSTWVGLADARPGNPYLLYARERVGRHALTFESSGLGYFRFAGAQDEVWLESGDSGGPTLLPYAGKLWLFGTHYAVSGSGQIGDYSIDASVWDVRDLISMVSGYDVQLIPEPAGCWMMVVAAAVVASRRRGRRAGGSAS